MTTRERRMQKRSPKLQLAILGAFLGPWFGIEKRLGIRMAMFPSAGSMVFVLNLARTAPRLMFPTLSSGVPRDNDAVDEEVPAQRDIPLMGLDESFRV